MPADRIWLAYCGPMTSAVVCDDPKSAQKYRDQGWLIEGPYVLDSEPVWEYRVMSHLGAMSSPDGSNVQVYQTREVAQGLATYFSVPCWVQRRRVASRPGPWVNDAD